MEPDYEDMEVEVAVHKDHITLRVGNYVARLSSEEAMNVAEALAEASSYLDGYNSDDDLDDGATHSAPETLQ